MKLTISNATIKQEKWKHTSLLKNTVHQFPDSVAIFSSSSGLNNNSLHNSKYFSLALLINSIFTPLQAQK